MNLGLVRAENPAWSRSDSEVLRALVRLQKESHESFFDGLVAALSLLLEVDSVVVLEFPSGNSAPRVLAARHLGELTSPFPWEEIDRQNAIFEMPLALEHNAAAQLGDVHPLVRRFEAAAVLTCPLITASGALLGWLAAANRSPLADLEQRRSLLELFGRQTIAELEYREKTFALRKSRGRYRRFFEENLAGAFVTTVQGEILACNGAFAEMLGYPSTRAVLEVNAYELYWESKDRSRFLDRLREEGNVQYSDIRLLRRDGRSVYVSGFVRASYDSSGEISEMTGFVVDQTEKKMAQERAQKQEELLNRTDDAILVCNLEGIPIFWNYGAEELFGVAASDAGSLALEDLIGDVKGVSLRSLWQMVLESGEWLGELQRPMGEDRFQIVRSRWSLLRDDTGRPTSVLMIGADITESRAIEAAMRRTQRMESLGTLAGGIAHDLNNILAPIQLSLQLLKPKLQSPEDRHLLSMLASAARRGTEMVRQVLSFARGVEGKRMPVKVSHLVEEMQRIFQETMPKSIEMSVSYARDLPLVLGDGTQIYQVLMNLCINARDAMPSGGQLLIQVTSHTVTELQAKSSTGAKAGQYVVLEVADTGIGIPNKVLDNIFVPFFSTKDEKSGTGLGLTTAYSIVKSHGGFIDVKSESGKGTSFRVFLPAIEGKNRSVESEGATPSTLKSSTATVLVVDDNVAFLQVVSRVLEEDGYRVLAASGGVEALNLFAEDPKAIDAVLCDQEMAYLDGTSTLGVMKRMNPGIRIALISGNPEFTPAVDSVVVLAKPCSGETLLKTMAGLLSEDQDLHEEPPDWEG